MNTPTAIDQIKQTIDERERIQTKLFNSSVLLTTVIMMLNELKENALVDSAAARKAVQDVQDAVFSVHDVWSANNEERNLGEKQLSALREDGFAFPTRNAEGNLVGAFVPDPSNL